MKANNEKRKASPYLLLLAVQILGDTLTWQVLPEFGQLAINPGDQLPRDCFSDIVSVGLLCVMQIAFWCRALFVPIPFRRPHAILNHVFLFLGKLSVIFGRAFFGIIVFRHLPQLDRGTDFLLAAKRGMIVIGCLFALFCTSLEVERLGQAFERNRN
jgi:hypothetical protein